MNYKGSVVASVPWVPTNDEVIEKLIEVLKEHTMKLGRGLFVDIGCGDGRVAIAVAQRLGLPTLCVEVKAELAARARRNVERAGVGHLVDVLQGDFFTFDFSRAKYVYMYLLLSVNTKLEPKLRTELNKGTLVITLDFPIPGWKSVKQIELDHRSWQRRLYVYLKGVSDDHTPALT
ncbi:Methyltransferase type 11 [Pyrolobus fumarii 1A]|uniref:Methyltransferase type 11 n=1 Tax=Pyrolobus fumarii (strain DSM 11204 / 1A) TaxID=694429 RepID=G0EHR3_PYRF1|nr:methyltransferase domain-containing protein [Pyrolobus fumarii]AEM39416.1 Methyltransferase type 11 [Pyrolobus fumarii 1A]